MRAFRYCWWHQALKALHAFQNIVTTLGYVASLPGPIRVYEPGKPKA